MIDNLEELFIVVDENDKIIGYKTRYECHHNKDLIHRSVGVVIYNKKGKILLQKRSMKKDLNPGKYTISVGGHVTKGQAYKAAAKREMQEELGISVPLIFVKKHIMKNNQESEMAMLYKAMYDGPFFPNKDEVESVDFFSENKIRNMVSKLTPHAKETFEKIGVL